MDEGSTQGKIIKIVTRLKSGDQQAFEELYELTHNKVYFLALKMVRNHENALEIIQETYISVYKSIDKLINPEVFNAWLSKIVVNKCKDFLGNKKDVLLPEKEDYEDNDASEAIEDISGDFIPHEVLDKSETRNMIMALIDNLPEAQRTTLLLHYYQGLNVEEIAAIMECPAATVKSRLIYARRQIKTGVEGYEKQGVKLYNVAVVPLIIFIMEAYAKENALGPAAATKIISTVSAGMHIGSAATQTASYAVTQTAAQTATQTQAESSQVHLLPKIAALSIRTKIVSGIVAGTVAISAVAIPIVVIGNRNRPVSSGITTSTTVNTIDNKPNNIINDSSVTQQGDWIYYGDDNNINSSYYLYGIHPDGTGRKKLSNDFIRSINVVGDWIYYTVAGYEQLYKMHTDGTGPIDINNDPVYGVNIIGDWIYYTGNKQGPLYKIRTDGTGKTKLNSDETLDINVVGDWIYYLKHTAYTNYLYKIRTDGTERTKLMDSLDDIHIEGDWIYFLGRGKKGTEVELYKIRTDGNGYSDVCTLHTDDNKYFKTNIIDIEGDWVYFGIDIYSNASSHMNNLYKVRKDGSGYTKLSDDNLENVKFAKEWIYYENISDNHSLYKIRTDGTEMTKLSSDNSLNYIITSDWIYYCNDSDNKYLYKIRTDGTEKTKLNSDVSSFIKIVGD